VTLETRLAIGFAFALFTVVMVAAWAAFRMWGIGQCHRRLEVKVDTLWEQLMRAELKAQQTLLPAPVEVEVTTKPEIVPDEVPVRGSGAAIDGREVEL
jgi:hypothetical protein